MKNPDQEPDTTPDPIMTEMVEEPSTTSLPVRERETTSEPIPDKSEPGGSQLKGEDNVASDNGNDTVPESEVTVTRRSTTLGGVPRRSFVPVVTEATRKHNEGHHRESGV
jgi:hypothetical protein